MLVELSTKEVAKKLSEEGQFNAKVRNNNQTDWKDAVISGVNFSSPTKYHYLVSRDSYCQAAIDVPDEYEPYPESVCPKIKSNWVKHKLYDVKFLITGVYEESTGHLRIKEDWLDNEYLFKTYTWEDGSPIGVLKGNSYEK